MKNDNALMKSHIDKMKRAFLAALVVITVFELVMMIRGFALFNLERLKLRLYLYSYIFLFVTSLTTLIIFYICSDKEEHLKKEIVTMYVYSFCFMMWSALVTCVDCYANGDSGIMVYVTTCISMGILTLIKPLVFISYLGVSGTFVLVFTAFSRGWTPYSSGFYINFFVFVAAAIFVNTHNYRLSLREFEASRKLKKLSYIDQLTGVYNRRSLDGHIDRKTKDGEGFCFVLLDIDKFKQVNDTYGHPKGDTCLVALACILDRRFDGAVYRFGGDEFAVISSLSCDELSKELELVNAELDEVFEDIKLRISAGIYKVPPGDLPENIFINSDAALYEAKELPDVSSVIWSENKNT